MEKLENSGIIYWQALSLTPMLLILYFCEVYIFCIANIKLLEIGCLFLATFP